MGWFQELRNLLTGKDEYDPEYIKAQSQKQKELYGQAITRLEKRKEQLINTFGLKPDSSQVKEIQDDIDKLIAGKDRLR